MARHRNNVLLSLTRGQGSPQAATWGFVPDLETLGVARTTDPNGHVSTRAYSPQGSLTSHTDALGRDSHFTYDGFQQVLTAKDRWMVT